MGFCYILARNLYHCNDKSNQLKRFIFETWEAGENRSNRGKKYKITSCTLKNEVQSCAHLVLPWVKAFE